MSRPFLLSVDSAAHDEPPNRYFGSLKAATDAMTQYDERFQRFAWITELRDGEPNVVHVKDGRLVPDP